ncbi:MAG: hypothetical protein IPK35_15515 [Saprospiraceae bacterium]|jgi:hypothetical protein|nr:hypothetical protein [Saprospiraceae bacterium]
MNTKTFIILIVCFFCLTACYKSQNAVSSNATVVDESLAKKDILNAIEQETKCFFERNYDCWAEHWSHKAYAYQAWNNSDGSVGVAAGWTEIDKQSGEYIKLHKADGTSHPEVKRDTIRWKFFSDSLAFLMWKQYNADRDGKAFQVSYETRLMEKSDNKWRILNVSAFWDSKNKVML